MADRWSREQLIWILRTVHCINEGHYEELPAERRKTVDLDVERLIEQYDLLERDCKILASLLFGAYKINEIVAEALDALIAAKDHKDLLGKTPEYERMRGEAWEKARKAKKINDGKMTWDGDPM